MHFVNWKERFDEPRLLSPTDAHILWMCLGSPHCPFMESHHGPSLHGSSLPDVPLYIYKTTIMLNWRERGPRQILKGLQRRPLLLNGPLACSTLFWRSLTTKKCKTNDKIKVPGIEPLAQPAHIQTLWSLKYLYIKTRYRLKACRKKMNKKPTCWGMLLQVFRLVYLCLGRVCVGLYLAL